MNVNLGPHIICADCGSILLLCQNPKCGKPFARGPEESDVRWGSRRYCSVPCANAIRQILIHGEWTAATKPCTREGCSDMIVQRRTESPASFEERKFHDRECATIARRSGKLSTREQRAQRSHAARERRAYRREPKPVETKPLIRANVPVVKVEVPPEVWRPAAWKDKDPRFA